MFAWVLISMVAAGVYGYIPGIASEDSCRALGTMIILQSPSIPDTEKKAMIDDIQCIRYPLAR